MRTTLFVLGLIGAVGFGVLGWLAMHLTPGYNPIADPASNLASEQFGAYQTAAFVVGGISYLLFALASWSGLKSVSRLVPWLIGLFGIVLVIESFFPSNPLVTDAPTRIHMMLFMLGIAGLLIATVTSAIVLRLRSSSMAVYTGLTALISLIGFIGLIATQGTTGLMQQLTVGPLFLWTIIVAGWAIRQPTQTPAVAANRSSR